MAIFSRASDNGICVEPMVHGDTKSARAAFINDGYALVSVLNIETAQAVFEDVVENKIPFRYDLHGVSVSRADDWEANTTSVPLYGDAPSVSTQAHNEGSYNDVFPKYFGLWMNQQANIGGMTQLWNTVKICDTIKIRMPEFWKDYKEKGLLYCTNHPDENNLMGKQILESWNLPGIKTYSKSMQQSFNVTDEDLRNNSIEDLLPTKNKHTFYRIRKWGLEKCRLVSGIHETIEGESCPNQIAAWSKELFRFGYGLPDDFRPWKVELGNRKINFAEWHTFFQIHETPQFQYKLKNNEMLIVDNVRVGHGRTPHNNNPKREATLFLYGYAENSFVPGEIQA